MHGFKYIFKYTYIKNIYFLLVAGRNQYSVISVRCCSVRSVCIHLSTYIGTHTHTENQTVLKKVYTRSTPRIST